MEQRPQSRPRSKSQFSFKSDKSHKEHPRESADEKRRSHITTSTKANPNAAMNEAQPIAAALEKPTLQSLRSFQHTDTSGNVIAEPDLSNPTRPRWERPLDTIRSFEAAIDTEYKRRSHAMRAESSPDAMSGYASRRSSYYGGHEQNNNRYSQVSGYYGSRAAAAGRESYYGADNGHSSMGAPRSRYNQRLQSDPMLNRYSNGQPVYPSHGYQQSRDTVNTGGSAGSQSEPWTNSTDPSSDNSSIERSTPAGRHPELGEQYGFAGFGGNPILEEYGNGGQGPSQNSEYLQQHHAPPVPAKMGNSNNGRPIPLGDSTGQQAQDGANPRPMMRSNTDKRKSWFKRRFSKE